MTALVLGTEQRLWRRYAPVTGSVPPLPAKDAYAYNATLPVGGGFDGNYIFRPDAAVVSGERLGDMACMLMFFFTKTADPVSTAVARIWGASKVGPGSPDTGPYLGVYLGQVEFTIGAANGLPLVSDPPKNVLLNNWYIASQIIVHDDVAIRPPGIRVVGNDRSTSPATSGCTPFVLFDALGFDRIVVSLRWTGSGGTNGLGFFWRTM